MNVIRRFLAGLFMALVFSGTAHAAAPVLVYRGASVPDPILKSSLPSDPLEALNQSWAIVQSSFPARAGPCRVNSISSTTAFGECYNNHTEVWVAQNASKRWYCAANPANYVTETTICPDTCIAGQSTTYTWFKEWAYDSAGSSTVPGSEVAHPDPYCDGSCQWVQDLDKIEDITCQGPEEPSDNGYFATTCTYPYKSTGVTCTVKDPDPSAPEPTDPNPGTGDGGGDGDGDGGGDPGDGDGDGDGDGSGDGDGDGDGDGSGTGEGQCPTGQTSDGNGGCVSTGGGGPGEGGDEGGGECGIDGRPACKVKIDESGMPSDATRQAQQSAARTAALGAVDDGADDVSAVLGDDFPEVEDVPWLWNVSLPAGACSPISFNTRAITSSYDVCSHPLMTAWREAWAYLIGVLGAIYIWRRTMASVGSA